MLSYQIAIEPRDDAVLQIRDMRRIAKAMPLVRVDDQAQHSLFQLASYTKGAAGP
jgi:hypothetical protein